MKMIMIICPESRRADIRDLIASHEVHSFSELKEVTGEGVTGKRMGNKIWPGVSNLIFTVTDDRKKDELLAALKHCSEHLYPGEGLKAFVLPVEEVL
ncbi:MAG: PG0541 family transporter-associated protein [Kiritimatiellia bacterium]